MKIIFKAKFSTELANESHEPGIIKSVCQNQWLLDKVAITD